MSNSVFDQKVFDFITKEENFESAFEIHQKMEDRKGQLIIKFWELVAIKMEHRPADKWKMFNNESEEIGIYLDEWMDSTGTIFCVYFFDIFSKLKYGIFIDELNKKRQFDNNKIDEYVYTNIFLSNYEAEEELIFQETQYDFNDLNTLKQILPHNREKLANELVQTLFDFAEKAIEPIKEMSKMIKK